MKKIMKKIVPVVACLTVAFASFGVTYAYLIANDSKVNEFRVGENDIEIVEEFTAPPELKPGANITKKPSVHNTGNLPCFVRMRVDFSDSEAEKFCEVDYNKTNSWFYNEGDGYYYYTKILQPGGHTEPELFTNVHIKEEYEENGVKKKYTVNDMIDFDIMVYAESKYNKANDIDKDKYWTEEDILAIWEVK